MWLRTVLALLSNGEARRRRRVLREFNRLIQAHDDAIARARLKHQPTAALIAAKREFIHQRLAAEIGR